MPKVSETTVRCGNKYCENESAKVDAICGNLISSPDEKCDYVNYSASKSVTTLRLIFLLPSVSDDVLEQLQEDGEIYIDLNGLKSVTDSDAFFKHAYSEDLGESVSKDLSSLLQSWGSTFGTQSELIPDPNQDEGPKFDSLVLTLEDDEIQVALEIQMYLKSYQYDMLGWYAKTLAESLMDEDDLVWMHEGTQISLLNVEVG
jgi:hypothetical protein